MIDFEYLNLPHVLQGITSTTEDLELTMAGELRFGSLLRTLAATMLGGKVLQVGAGSGILSAWLLDGMAEDASLTSIEPDLELAGVARRFLGRDQRFELLSGPLEAQLAGLAADFSLIVASTPHDLAGNLREALQLLRPGGLFVVGGVGEHEGWTAAERSAAQTLVSRLEVLQDVQLTSLDWSSGVLLACRKPQRAS